MNEYVQGVLEDLGITEKDALPHLSPVDRKAVIDQLKREAPAFWRAGSPRTCIRAFAHDVVTTGPPIRSHPIKLMMARGLCLEGFELSAMDPGLGFLLKSMSFILPGLVSDSNL